MTSSTTLVDDTHLSVTVDASCIYEVTGLFVYSAHQDADIRIAWSGPSGVTYNWITHAQLQGTTGTIATGGVVLDRQSIGSAFFPLGGAAAENTTVMTGTLRGLLVVGGTGGTFKLQWAQYASNGTSSIMRAGSYIVLRRVA